jgi:hypothetical protein
LTRGPRGILPLSGRRVLATRAVVTSPVVPHPSTATTPTPGATLLTATTTLILVSAAPPLRAVATPAGRLSAPRRATRSATTRTLSRTLSHLTHRILTFSASAA